MDIAVQDKGNVTILSPRGDIRVGEGDVKLRSVLKEQLEEGKTLFVLNLKDVRFLDSAGLGELVASLKRVAEKEGSLRICNANRRVSEALVVTKLIEILDVYESEAEAIASFV